MPSALAQGSVVVRDIPSDATVVVGGAVAEEGVPVEIASESALLRVTYASGAVLEEWLSFDGRDLEATIQPPRRDGQRALLSTVTPGLAQWQDGRRGTALALWTGILGGGAMVAVSNPIYTEARQSYAQSVEDYEAATSEFRAVAAREAAASSGSRADRARAAQRVGLGLALAAYAVAVGDTFAGGSTERASVRVQPVAPVTVGLAADRPGLSLRLSF